MIAVPRGCGRRDSNPQALRHQDLNLACLPNFTTPAALRPCSARAGERLYGRATMAEADVAIEHPNREKASSKVTRAIVVLLLLASAFVMIVISAGAWDALAGAKALQVIYILVYVGIAAMVLRWSRGVLPVAAALAIVLFIFAVVSVPGWFERDKDGFTDPAIASDVVGILTALLVPLQLLLIAFAMRGFQQAWNVEVERPADPPPPAARSREPAPVV